MTTYFLFVGDKQDDGTEHGMYDYERAPDSLIEAYEIVLLLRHKREINYAHLAQIYPNGSLGFVYELVEVMITKPDGLKMRVEAWREHNGDNLVIMQVMGEELHADPAWWASLNTKDTIE